MPDTAATPGTRTDLALLEDLVDEVEDVFHGKREVVRLALAGPLFGASHAGGPGKGDGRCLEGSEFDVAKKPLEMKKTKKSD